MKVFLSWSGPTSNQVATALHDYLPFFLQSIKPFISSLDISKGEKWSDKITGELKGADLGIVCVTPFNMHRPWMNFEAGALVHLPQLVPLLFRVDGAALGHSPLREFQVSEIGEDDDHSKSEFLRLIESINGSLPEHERLATDVLRANFDIWWPKLRDSLKAIPTTSSVESRTAYKWLRTFEELDVHNLQPNCHDVWFVTKDVFTYAIRFGVQKKLETSSTVKYRYLIPEPDGASEREVRDQLESLTRAHQGRIDFRCFARDVFEKQAASDYVIIVESQSADNDRIRVLVRIPLNKAESEYWFETEEHAAIGFYNRFSELWNSANTGVLPALSVSGAVVALPGTVQASL